MELMRELMLYMARYVKKDIFLAPEQDIPYLEFLDCNKNIFLASVKHYV